MSDWTLLYNLVNDILYNLVNDILFSVLVLTLRQDAFSVQSPGVTHSLVISYIFQPLLDACHCIKYGKYVMTIVPNGKQTLA